MKQKIIFIGIVISAILIFSIYGQQEDFPVLTN